MANEPKTPSQKTSIDVEADQLTPEDLEKIAAGRVSVAKINVTNLSGGPVGAGGVGGVRQTLTKK